LQFLDDSTALLRLPTFSEEYGPVIDSLVGANRRRLEATRYFVVDVRGNGGGSTESYRSITPLVYANPVRFEGADVWASPANIAHYRAMLSDTLLSRGFRQSIQEAVVRMERHVNQWLELRRDTVVALDTCVHHAADRRRSRGLGMRQLVRGLCARGAAECQGYRDGCRAYSGSPRLR
jgi:hypothetical protein